MFASPSSDWIISAVLKYINFPITDRHLWRTGAFTLEPYICKIKNGNLFSWVIADNEQILCLLLYPQQTWMRTGRRSIPNCCRSSGWSANNFSRAEISGAPPLISSCLLELPAGDFFKREPLTNTLVLAGRVMVPLGNGGRSSLAKFTISKIWRSKQKLKKSIDIRPAALKVNLDSVKKSCVYFEQLVLLVFSITYLKI